MTLTQIEVDDKISRALRTPEGELLMEKVRERRHRVVTDMAVCDDILEMGRNQGKLTILDWIMRMREND